MTVSFKQFALQFLGLKLPVRASAAAAAAGFVNRPISLRAVMNSAAPYVPDTSKYAIVDSSNNVVTGKGPPVVAFFWMDPANYPPWVSTTGSYDQRRQATSWTVTVWEAQAEGEEYKSFGTIGNPVIDAATVPFSSESGGLVQYDYTSIQLNGQYACQITAFDAYDSTSTAKIPIAITIPGVTPSIALTYLGTTNQNFQIKGTGFTPRGGVKISATVGGYGWFVYVPVADNGTFDTTQSVVFICKQAGGGQLQFQATDLATNSTSNQPTAQCH
jgi:hypothetical protein